MEADRKPTKRILELKDELVETLQNYSRGQVELWRQVPELAQEAEKSRRRSGQPSSGRYMTASMSGYWPISNDIHWLWVDLKTGELGRSQLFEEIELGQLNSILDGLDAEKVIASLRADSLSSSATV